MNIITRTGFQRQQIGLSETLVIFMGVVLFFLPGDYRHLGIQIVAMIIFALSLDLAMGYGGIESLGHAVFFGIGGYAAALFALRVSSDPLLGLASAAGSAALAAAIFGPLVLRAKGVTQVILTIAVAAVVLQFATTARWLTGGDDGLAGYSVGPIFGLFPFDFTGRVGFIYAGTIAILTFLLCRQIVNSSFGLTIRGIRENDLRMRLLGVAVFLRRLTLFVISGAIAGVAGGILAQTVGVAATDSLSFSVSGNVLVMLVIGGMGRLTGAIVGALVFMVLSDRAAAIDPFNWLFVLGVFLILIVRFMPDGVALMLDRIELRVWGRKQPR
ncbi:branched-chain amino acid ABC transporter permease [Bradyrhizobium betae]|uniref:Branched-chain amino acid ABC transporter permease n=1 Tax=Bradyrhizobium betae TaxID=244734 RepID=A0A4Q1VPQ8_9BRAD|nr:branched-chain amino acid ABC transporter permease [Bradyrhizobium betae]RXT54262.1 hypothetical protein B5V03_02140 [Bradyrhizobium betae]